MCMDVRTGIQTGYIKDVDKAGEWKVICRYENSTGSASGGERVGVEDGGAARGVI